MPEYKTAPLIASYVSGLLPEGERDRRAALTSFDSRADRAKIPGRDVICYECGRRSKVPAAALSANCIHCHAHLRMTDIDLKPNSSRLTVRTLGNVTVLPEAILSQLSIVCHNLHLLGKGSGTFRCSGMLKISSDSKVDGEVTAGSLLVERGADVIFVHGVKARTVEIYGRVTGRVEASGNVVLHRGAELCGNCYAPMLIVKSGATHRGAWQKISSSEAEIPLVEDLPPEI